MIDVSIVMLINVVTISLNSSIINVVPYHIILYKIYRTNKKWYKLMSTLVLIKY